MVTRKDLFNAIIFGDVEKASEILQSSKLSKIETKFNGVLITLAIRHKHLEMVKLLVSANLNPKKPAKFFLSKPLLFAAKSGNAKLIKYLVEMGADVNIQARNGCTPLHFAAFNNNVSIVKYLLLHGSLPSIKVRERKLPGFTALHYACLVGSIKCVKMLVKFSSDQVNPKNDDEVHPIHVAVGYDERQITKFLINYIDNVNLRFIDNLYGFPNNPITTAIGSTNEGPTLLHWAVAGNNFFITSLLIEHCANLDRKTLKSGITPLMLAAQGRDMSILTYILRRNPDVNSVDYSGNTALHYAFYNKDLFRWRYSKTGSLNSDTVRTKVELLLSYGANATAECSFESLPYLTSALDLAIYFECHRTVRYLLYNTRIGMKQIDFSKFELAYFDEDAVDDSIRDDIDYIEIRKIESQGIQCTLAAYIFTRHSIGLHATKDTLAPLDVLTKIMDRESWYDGYYATEKEHILSTFEHLKKNKIGLGAISYWDVIKKDNEDLVKLAFNEDFPPTSIITTQEIRTNIKFYHLSTILECKFTYANAKSAGLGKVIEVLSDLFAPVLPYHCVEKIADVMSNDELRSVLKCFDLNSFIFNDYDDTEIRP